MCDPITIMAVTTAALSAGQAVMGFVGQNQAAHANEVAANVNYAHREEALSAQKVQVDAQHSQDVFSDAIDAARNQGHIAASASDYGLGAQSLTQQYNTSAFDTGRVVASQDFNYSGSLAQLGRDSTGAAIERQSQINSVRPESPIALALGIGQAAVKGASTYFGMGGGK